MGVPTGSGTAAKAPENVGPYSSSVTVRTGAKGSTATYEGKAVPYTEGVVASEANLSVIITAVDNNNPTSLYKLKKYIDHNDKFYAHTPTQNEFQLVFNDDKDDNLALGTIVMGGLSVTFDDTGDLRIHTTKKYTIDTIWPWDGPDDNRADVFSNLDTHRKQMTEAETAKLLPTLIEFMLSNDKGLRATDHGLTEDHNPVVSNRFSGFLSNYLKSLDAKIRDEKTSPQLKEKYIKKVKDLYTVMRGESMDKLDYNTVSEVVQAGTGKSNITELLLSYREDKLVKIRDDANLSPDKKIAELEKVFKEARDLLKVDTDTGLTSDYRQTYQKQLDSLGFDQSASDYLIENSHIDDFKTAEISQFLLVGASQEDRKRVEVTTSDYYHKLNDKKYDPGSTELVLKKLMLKWMEAGNSITAAQLDGEPLTSLVNQINSYLHLSNSPQLSSLTRQGLTGDLTSNIKKVLTDIK